MKSFVSLIYTSDVGENWQSLENEFIVLNAIVTVWLQHRTWDTLYALIG
jgi:hypothetical protein